MVKLKILYTTKVRVEDVIELTDKEFEKLKSFEHYDVNLQKGKKDERKEFLLSKGFKNPSYQEESFINMASENEFGYEIISKANKIDNITDFNDPYIEDIYYEKID